MAGAAGALRGRVVPALVVERVGDGRRAKQADDLLLAHAGLQLVDRRFLEQVALVDQLPVDDAATEIGRAHVGTPVPNAHLVYRLLRVKKTKTKDTHLTL